jgi:flagellar assembly protein FliH
MEEFKLNPVKETKNKVSNDIGNFQSGFDKVFDAFGNNKEATTNSAADNTNLNHKNKPKQPIKNVPEQVAKDEPKITEYDLVESNKNGYEKGYSKGYSDAKNKSEEINNQINETIKNVDAKLSEILQVRKFEDLKKSEDVINLALRVARKVSDNSIKENACQMVENVIVKSFEILFDEPRILICVNSKIIEDIKKRINNLVKSEGFSSEVEVVASDNIAVGDCKIQWQGGGLITDHEAVWKDIEAMLQ